MQTLTQALLDLTHPRARRPGDGDQRRARTPTTSRSPSLALEKELAAKAAEEAAAKPVGGRGGRRRAPARLGLLQRHGSTDERTMNGAVAAAAFLPGLAIGSFLNVVAARVPARLSIVSPGSSCPQCHTAIALVRQHPGRLVPRCYAAAAAAARCTSRRSTRSSSSTTALLVSACFLAFGLTADAAISRVLLRRARDDLRHRPRAARDPEPRRPPRRRARARRADGRAPLADVGDRRRRRLAVPARSPRSPTPAGSAWATSSSRCFSAPRSASRSRSG